jgi:cobalt/nickel transport system permease protein
MHIPDGVLSPAVCAVTGAVSLAAVGYSLHRLKRSVGERTIPLTGMMASVVFAGQMVNFPIGAPVSGHLLGGVLAATVAGPWAGCVAMTLVLFVQWALFSDGGLFTLGANVLHMAVVGSLGGHAVRLVVQRIVGGGRKGIVVGSVVAAWTSVMAAAALFCLEFQLSWPADEFDFSKLFTWMVSFHSLIGVGEALITGVAVSFVMSQRPELMIADGRWEDRKVEGWGATTSRTFAAGLVFALAVAAFLSPFASEFPDGLEAAFERLSIADLNLTQSVSGLFESYDKVPVPIASWQWMAVSIAGVGGTLAVFGLAWLLGKALPASSPVPCSEATGE